MSKRTKKIKGSDAKSLGPKKNKK